MRWLLGLVLIFGVRDASASCSGFCHIRAELIGWSKDGKTIVVKETHETSRVVVYTNHQITASWDAGAVPGNAYSKLDLVMVDASWRSAFQSRFTVRPSTTTVKIESDPKCTTHEVVDQNGKVAARVVRTCNPNLTECISGRVLGGYVHPSGDWLVVKSQVHSCGYTSTQGYQLVSLK